MVPEFGQVPTCFVAPESVSAPNSFAKFVLQIEERFDVIEKGGFRVSGHCIAEPMSKKTSVDAHSNAHWGRVVPGHAPSLHTI
jgi:hypothetical protein